MLILSTLLLSTEVAKAQQADSSGYYPQFKRSVTINRTSYSIDIDGELNDPGWRDAERITGFAEIDPGDNTKPLVRTEVLITYDPENLYVAFIAHDDPGKIRVSLQDRDNMFSDDWVGMFLDTYGNASWAYEIHANPLGVQGDGRFTQENEDMSFDLIYKTEGKITSEGYQVEFAIPFRSLRFPNRNEQVWRVTFFRNHPRASRHQYSWAALNRDNPCILCQLGYLKGIRGVTSGRNVEFLPEALIAQQNYLFDDEDPESGYVNKDVDAGASLGIKYGITSNSTVDLTINPDFSQVEADPAQIDVNSTFALFYPERRPFFQEGSDLFGTWMDLVYTRSINDPSVAAKFTGRFNKTEIAYIGARDERTPIILPFEEGSEFVGDAQRIRSVSNILRLRRIFSEESHIGLLVTDRRLDQGGSGSILSADGGFRFLQHYRWEMQVAASHTAEPNDTSLTSEIDQYFFGKGHYDVLFNGEQYWGYSSYASLERDARIWDFDLNYRVTSPTFRAANGFVTGNDNQSIQYNMDWEFYPKHKLVDHIDPGINVGSEWNFDNVRKDEWFVPFLNFTFTRQTHLSANYVWSRQRYHDIDFSGIRRFEMSINSNFSDPFTAGFYFGTGGSIARNEDPPLLGNERSLSVWSTIKPMKTLMINPEIDYATMTNPATDTTIYSGYIFRTRVNLQFTRSLFLRLFIQYDDFNNNLDFDPLITYRINAFSVIYLGSTHDYHDFGNPYDYRRTARQYFLKVRYLVQV